MNSEPRVPIVQLRSVVLHELTRQGWPDGNPRGGKRLEASIRADADDIREEPDWTQAVMGVPAPKDHINIRVDRDVLEWFRASGRGYQTLMNSDTPALIQFASQARALAADPSCGVAFDPGAAYCSADPSGISALGALAVTKSDIRNVHPFALMALSAIHTRETLPFLVRIMNGPDEALHKQAVAGIHDVLHRITDYGVRFRDGAVGSRHARRAADCRGSPAGLRPRQKPSAPSIFPGATACRAVRPRSRIQLRSARRTGLHQMRSPRWSGPELRNHERYSEARERTNPSPKNG
jgi:uncharacterized protein (DUF4415 family)